MIWVNKPLQIVFGRFGSLGCFKFVLVVELCSRLVQFVVLKIALSCSMMLLVVLDCSKLIQVVYFGFWE